MTAGVDNSTATVEVCPLMFAALRSLAPAVLLLASLSGHAATGIVLAHVAIDHAVTAGHEEHHASDHYASDHDAEAGDEHQDTDRGSRHTHQIIPAATSAPARITSPSIDVQPDLAVVGQGHFDRPDSHAVTCLARPALRAEPPEPQRHSILLL